MRELPPSGRLEIRGQIRAGVEKTAKLLLNQLFFFPVFCAWNPPSFLVVTVEMAEMAEVYIWLPMKISPHFWISNINLILRLSRVKTAELKINMENAEMIY